jgi:hypothetical protein
MNNLAPAPRRGNMLNVYNVIGLNTVGLRVITKASKLGKEKTKSTLQNLVFKGYVIKAGSYYCLNTRIEFDTRQAEISKVQDSKKAESPFQQFADQENARRQGAMNAEFARGLGGLGQTEAGWDVREMLNYGPSIQSAETQADMIAKSWKVAQARKSWVTSDRLYIASLTIIVIAHLLRDGGVL